MHKKWCDAQKELYPDEPVRQLQRLSDTRWACLVVACRNVRDRLDALIVTLEDAAEGGHSDRSVEAIGLLSHINFNFVLLLHLCCDLLGKIHSVSTQLQSSTLDLSAAVVLLKNLIECLKECRQSDSFVDCLHCSAEAICR